MAISHNDCTPYLSATLFRLDREDGQVVTQLRQSISDVLADTESHSGCFIFLEREIVRPIPRKLTRGGLDIAWFYYLERRPPPWYAANELSDLYHHIAIVCRKGRLASLSFSDAGARNAVVRKIGTSRDGPFSRLARLSSSEVDAAFVDNQVRTLWLSGAHRRTVIKPDAKVLSGLELELALDPLEDQSYYFSSVRSTSSNKELASEGRPAVIGASPRSARIWIGPTRSWDGFAGRMEAILDHAAKKTRGRLPQKPPLPVLARPSRGFDDVESPYDMAIIVPELDLAGIDAVNGDERWLQQFGDAARFEIDPKEGSPDFEAAIFWGDEQLGRLNYDFAERDNGEVHLTVEKLEWDDESDHQNGLFRICRNPDFLTIYFDTGHTFSRGQFYLTQFRDVRFSEWEWVNMNRDGIVAHQEKPVDKQRFAVENIGNSDDKSLFGLVARHWPNLEDRGDQRGWLICDDGSMESADFIHFDDALSRPSLTLIHVKGSGSKSANRRLSVSDYEVVVGQAVKNLRHVDQGRLAEKLMGNSDGQLRDAVWRDGVRQASRDGVLEALNAAGSNMDKTVVVLQPSVRLSVYNAVRTKMDQNESPDAETRRMQQLDTLLLGARADCLGLGARFSVIAEDDT